MFPCASESGRRVQSDLMAETLRISQGEAGGVTIAISGPLDLETAPGVWDQAVRAATTATKELVLDLTGLGVCDGVGVGLLAELDRSAPGQTRLDGGSDELHELLKMARLEKGQDTRAPSVGFFSSVGQATAALLATIHALISFTGDVTAAIIPAIRTLNGTRLREILRNCVRVGADAVPVVSFLGLLIGYILSVQATKALETVGTTSLVPMVVGFSTFREFGALIAAIILAGRSGSAFAAELGTMKVTEEMDAYRTLGLNPIVVLVIPRILAGVIVTPLLTIYSIVLAIVGGSIPLLTKGYSFGAYIDSVFNSVVTADFAQAMVKGLVFGLLVAMLGCFHGMRTGRGADAVGASTTKAVVAGIVAVLIADSIVSTIFYNLGY